MNINVNIIKYAWLWRAAWRLFTKSIPLVWSRERANLGRVVSDFDSFVFPIFHDYALLPSYSPSYIFALDTQQKLPAYAKVSSLFLSFFLSLFLSLSLFPSPSLSLSPKVLMAGKRYFAREIVLNRKSVSGAFWSMKRIVLTSYSSR